MPAAPPDHRLPVSRRDRGVTALVTLAVSLPSMVISCLLVYGAGALGGPSTALGLTLTWLLVGPLIPPPTPDMAPLIFRVRRPRPEEQAALIPAWHNVAQLARVHAGDYSLWVQDTRDVNALSAPGRIVAVTGWAIAALGPRELEAVLAHELGHHLGGGQRAHMLAYWYGLPVALIRTGYRKITWLFAVFVAQAAHIVGFVALLRLFGVRKAMDVICFAVLTPTRALVFVAAVIGAATMFAIPVAVIAAAALLAEPFAKQAQRRWSEIRADAVAVDLGYGQQTHTVLDLWLRRVSTRREPGPLARLLDSHPPIETRLRAVRARVETSGCVIPPPRSG